MQADGMRSEIPASPAVGVWLMVLSILRRRWIQCLVCEYAKQKPLNSRIFNNHCRRQTRSSRLLTTTKTTSKEYSRAQTSSFRIGRVVDRAGCRGGGALAATTTLTFDEYSDGTVLTTQYQGVGVTVSGATVLPAVYTPYPANSAPNIAYAPTGLMTFTLNSAITGNIQSVSAYVSADASTGIYAYDAGGLLVGQALTPGATNNLFVSVTSTGNPIARVDIHDGGASFGIDTLRFATVVVNNVKPVADAGDKQKVRINSLVTLDGSRSVDPDHQPQPLTYLWTQTAGPAVTLAGATTARPTFTPPTQGNYSFSLVVSDGQDNSNASKVTVTASKNGKLSAIEVSGALLNPFGQ